MSHNKRPFPSFSGPEQADMCELRAALEEPGGRGAREVYGGVHPEAGGGV